MRFYCNVDQFEVSIFQWFTFLMLLSYYRLQEVDWILNKRRPRVKRGVNRFSDRRIWPQKSHGLWIFAVNRADWRILKTLWIVDQL